MWIYPLNAFSLYSVFYVLVCNFGSRVLRRYNTTNVVLLWYVVDFLLVNIFTLFKRLRDRELRVRVSGITADLAHFCA